MRYNSGSRYCFLALCFVSFIASLAFGSTSLTAILQRGQRGCFDVNVTEEGQYIFFHYLLLSSTQPVKILAYDPNTILIWESDNYSSNQALLRSDDIGLYTFCMEVAEPYQNLVTFGIDVIGEDHTEEESMGDWVKEEAYSKVATGVKQMLSTLDEMKGEQEYLDGHIRRHMKTVISIGRRIIRWSFVEMAIILLMGAFYVFCLKRAFATRRVI